jgi:hypothetical protein
MYCRHGKLRVCNDNALRPIVEYEAKDIAGVCVSRYTTHVDSIKGGGKQLVANAC